MYKLCIFGAGGFAKEVYWLAQQCGFEVDAFIDLQAKKYCAGKKVMTEDYLNPISHKVIVAVGNPQLRERITNKIIEKYKYDIFQDIIALTANIMSSNVDTGIGSVICANCILTGDIKLGNFSQLNLATTIGHDVKTGDFFTTAPQVAISGNVTIGNNVYLGTNSSVIEGINICDNVIIGANACVTRDITESGTYVGVPAKKIK